MTDEDKPSTAPGTRLFADRYTLGTVLGRGGMADVYRAEDAVLGRSVAVKIFRPTESVLTDARRIQSEMRTLASLSHPGLVTLFDAGTARDSEGADAPYLVMELIDGPTLNTFRSGAALAPEVVARIGYELAEALAYIHAAGVVHRDIKPANILLTGSPNRRDHSTKLTDFGIARVLDADPLTEHGTAVGTAHYLSPEQATGAPTGPSADVYSLGLVLIECLSGKMVFEGSSIAAAVARLHHDPQVPSHLGNEWASLLTAMTSRQPDERPDAKQCAARLRSLAETESSGTVATAVGPVLAAQASPATRPPLSTAEAPTAQAGPSSRARVVWALVAGLLGAATIAAAIAIDGSSTPGSPVSDPTAPTAVTTASADPPAPTTVAVQPPAPAPPHAQVIEEPAPAAPPPADLAPIAPEPGNGNTNGNGNNNGNGNGGNGNGGNGNGSGNGGNGNGGGNSGNGNGR